MYLRIYILMRSASLLHSGLVVDDDASSSTSNLMGTLLVMLKRISLSAEVGGGLGGGVSSPAMVAEFFVDNVVRGNVVSDAWKCDLEYHEVDNVVRGNVVSAAWKCDSKAGKRFAFVWFIKVFNHLRTIWIGRYHLYANHVRFERPPKPNSIPNTKAGVPNRPSNPSILQHSNGRAGSYANIVNGVSSGMHGSSISPSPALVLDDTCLVERDLSKHAMGKVKDFTSIPNLYTILKDEGFSDVKLTYLGGTWVLFEFTKTDTKENMMSHTGVNSWFHVIQDARIDFVSEERIVWVDIEGIPLSAWSRETFDRIGKKWGETLDLEDNADTSFGRKRLCVKTKHPVSILETFKIVVKGRVFMVRAKELFTWNPTFLGHKEREYSSDEESVHASKNNEFSHHPNEEEFGGHFDSDDDGVPETVFGSNYSPHKHDNGDKENTHSEDPFGLYNLLESKKRGVNRESSPSLSHPPGFTPEDSEKRDIGDNNNNVIKEAPVVFSAKVMNTSQDVSVEAHNDSVDLNVVQNGGSVLGVMEDIIRVGQAMGYTMEGSVKDLENIIGQQGEDNVIR
ncbi:RNA-directed DNA polymerase, eukaryota [Tanacetum coccineum]|uniref:RNA-directed DNA polymerase, eukaryota n=1 Tax=Tanacetum coccineum TaxID=301880 RepID=A0ABQ5FFK1_9ASTR